MASEILHLWTRRFPPYVRISEYTGPFKTDFFAKDRLPLYIDDPWSVAKTKPCGIV